MPEAVDRTSSASPAGAVASGALPVVVALATIGPALPTFLLAALMPGQTWILLPLHSTMEAIGAALGLVLAILLLFGRQADGTSRTTCIALALVCLSILDIAHASIGPGSAFIWTHSLAALGGGLFFVLAWLPDREVGPATMWLATGTVLIGCGLVGALSSTFAGSLPAMMTPDGSFTTTAIALNLVAGCLTLLAAAHFAARFHSRGNVDDLLLLALCLLFGVCDLLFFASHPWGASWWSWHVFRLGAYLFALLLAVFSYQSTQSELRKMFAYARGLIEASPDTFVLIGPDGRITDVNRVTEEISGVDRTQLIGSDFAGYFTEPDRARTVQQRVLTEGSVRDHPLDLRHRSGKTTPMNCNASAYRDEAGRVVGVFATARDVSDLRKADWLKTGLTRINDAVRGEEDPVRLAQKVIGELCKYLDAKVGVLYAVQDEGPDAGVLTLLASYAHVQRKNLASRFKPGEGLVGQAALEREQIVISSVPEDHIRVVSGLGDSLPRQICVTPFLFESHVRGVLEIGLLSAITPVQLDFLAQAAQGIGIAFETAMGRTRLTRELERSRKLAEELQSQQEELRFTNEELQQQTEALKTSEKRLQTQQEELRVTNEELQQQTEALKTSEKRLQTQQEELRVANEELEEKNDLLERQKREVEAARQEISRRADEVGLASKYKSEFLANMSHELRTPLNSLLLLARGLIDNKAGNLTSDQVEAAQVIHRSGNDLLSLINEILDLSKIEAGRMELVFENVAIQEVIDTIVTGLGPVASNQGLALLATVDPDVPATMRTDQKRLHQVLKNLVSNALKFTEQGSVTVRVHRPRADTNLSVSRLEPGSAIAFSVVDTGIGIAPEHQKLIFEAFRQVDGTTARRYGGTGLGLSICRELARIMGGEIQLSSTAGNGSTFTFYLPVGEPARPSDAKDGPGSGASVICTPDAVAVSPVRAAASIPDDRHRLVAGDHTILIIEDDSGFACALMRHCSSRGFKCLVATTGEEGLALARQYLPLAVVLDLRLPGIDGWQVLQRMRDDTRIRHIPVHIVSCEEPTSRSTRSGAVGHLLKPVTPDLLDMMLTKLQATAVRKSKRLLVVEDDEQTLSHLSELLASEDVCVDQARGAQEAKRKLVEASYDCVVLDVGLWDMRGDDLLQALSRDRSVTVPPVIIYTARSLLREEEERLREYTDSIIIKDVRSEERLLDEVSLFLHRAVSDMPPRQQRIIKDLHGSDPVLLGKKVLIVDDDMRSAFAVARLLGEHGIATVKAQNGERALAALDSESGIDLILMDVMMPVMDGHEATRLIRAQERFARLPIIAVTAKAMTGDRDRCIASGANDYLTKPIDQDRLLSTLRVWLGK